MNAGYELPRFKIDLSLAPAERYVALARLYGDKMRPIVGMFDQLVVSISPKIPLGLVHWLARLCLRRLYTADETAEVQGISRETGIDFYLLICFNVALDLLMGCTSGGVRCRSRGNQTHILHFRTLDWDMDLLRQLIVQLEYIDSDPHTVLATSITYVGFVGVLTGVKKDLSVSLNFRPVHDSSRNLPFYVNHLLVLLGLRQSISSLLRACIIPPTLPKESSLPSTVCQWCTRCSPSQRLNDPTLEDIVTRVPSLPTTAAYLIFCDGKTTVVMEKDYRDAFVRVSDSFIITTNHDQQPCFIPAEAVAEERRRKHTGLSLVASDVQCMGDLIEESNERYDCMATKWDDVVQEHMRVRQTEDRKPQPPRRRSNRLSLRSRKEQEEVQNAQKNPVDATDENPSITAFKAKQWLTTYPVLNECTHYAVLMMPSTGTVVWARRFTSEMWEDG